MRFLADESCDAGVTRALRAAGHDVRSIAEISPGVDDDAVIDLAVRERRVLLTEDKDFGQMVFAEAHASSGVVLIRFPSRFRATLPDFVVQFVKSYEGRLTGGFAVLQPGRIRISQGTPN